MVLVPAVEFEMGDKPDSDCPKHRAYLGYRSGDSHLRKKVMAKTRSWASSVRLAAMAGLSCRLSGVSAQAEPEQLILAENGKANAVVVVPKGAPSPVQFAAYELAAHLEQMTGAKFEVVAAKPDQGNAIIFGESEYSRAAGIDISKLKRDGYAIRVEPDSIYIVGRDDDNEQSKLLEHYTREAIRTSRTYGKRPHQWHFQRATLYGVYRFLEELGVRNSTTWKSSSSRPAMRRTTTGSWSTSMAPSRTRGSATAAKTTST